jgi:hypothetical protein
MMSGGELRSAIFGSVIFAALISPFVAKSDSSFVTPTVGQADGRVAISTNPLAPQFGSIFIDKEGSEIVAYFSTYFFENDVSCAPVTAIALVDGVLARWTPQVSVAEIIGEPRLKIENVDRMIEALFDAELLEVLLVNSCNGKTAYSFDLKGYERAMKKIGVE